jgi:hypothetical protein
MNEHVFALYLKDHVIGARKPPTCVSDSPKKPITVDKIQPLRSQRVGPKSGQPRVIRLGYFVMPFRMKKC